jgi:hypothetical protein
MRGMRLVTLAVFLAATANLLCADQSMYKIEARLEGDAILGRIEILYCNQSGGPLSRIPLELASGTALTDSGVPRVSSGKGILLPTSLHGGLFIA